MKDTKEHIVKTAFLLFLEKSYKAVTLKDIIQKTGLSNGAFYHYFESKEQLFKEVINTYLSRLVRKIWEYYPKDSLWSFIQDTLKDMDEIFTQMDEFFLIDRDYNYLFFIFEARRQFPEIQEDVNKLHKLEFASWVEIIDIAKAKGEIKADVPTELIARMFIYMPDGAYLNFLTDRSLDKFKFNTRRLWEGLYHVLKT
jgi:AcrR family transcriptional regulator